MVKICFKQDRVVQDGRQGTPHETRFSAGQVADLPEASANHWLTRGVAERVADAEEAGAPSAEQQPPPRVEASTQAQQQDLDLLNPDEGSGEGPEGEGASGINGVADAPAADAANAPATEPGPGTSKRGKAGKA
jgi:hypothetical protein